MRASTVLISAYTPLDLRVDGDELTLDAFQIRRNSLSLYRSLAPDT